MFGGAQVWRWAYVLVSAAFLMAAARYYHPGAGFTAFIEFPAGPEDYELPAVRNAPHYHAPESGGYDGQFYAQLAVEPLLRDGAIDRAIDNPPYRARRILFSWTAYALGGGDAARILRIYAVQNVGVWLALGWLLCRWMPPTGARNFALWSGCLLSHGMLSSVRYALPDGPSAFLIASAIGVAGARPAGTDTTTRGRVRTLGAALVVGLAGLARDTSVLAASMFVRVLGKQPRTWLFAAICVLVCVLPLALWLDYLRSIYRSQTLAGTDHLTTAFSGVLWKIQRIRIDAGMHGLTFQVSASAAALLGFLIQALVIVHELARSRGRSAWALVGASFLALAIFTHRDVFAGTPGAFTRAFLPVTFAANAILAARSRASWWLIAAVNLSVVPGVLLLWLGWG